MRRYIGVFVAWWTVYTILFVLVYGIIWLLFNGLWWIVALLLLLFGIPAVIRYLED